jgi:POT family proton-dependent oligopeptide transporter
LKNINNKKIIGDMHEATAIKTKHPKGLYVLFATEMWERFNFYGMRAILVLFMTKALLFDKVFASNLYGSYLSLVYLTPLIGGFMADKYWGNNRSIVTGGIVMAIGELVLFFCGSLYQSSPQLSSVLLFSGLGLMITGNGFFKPNISSLVGQLYPHGDKRKDAAYTIFYMGINVGGAVGPILCGLFGDTGNPADFKWAFLIAGIGMIISVIVQKMFQHKYVRDPENNPLGIVPASAPKKLISPLVIIAGMFLLSLICIALFYLDAKYNYLFYLLTACFVGIPTIIFLDKKLSKIEKEKVGVIFLVCFFVIFFWGAYEQAGASLTFFAEDQTQRDLGFYTVPASWFQSFNSIFIILLAPLFAWFWLKLGKREPASPFKMALGLFGLALGYLWIAFGVNNVGAGVKVSMIWLTGMYFLHTSGELCLSPIGMSLVNQLSPLKYSSLLMAVWFTANAFGNKLAGVLSALYPENGKTTSFLGYRMSNLHDFFMLFVFMAGIAAVILFLLSSKLKKMMN